MALLAQPVIKQNIIAEYLRVERSRIPISRGSQKGHLHSK